MTAEQVRAACPYISNKTIELLLVAQPSTRKEAILVRGVGRKHATALQRNGLLDNERPTK